MVPAMLRADRTRPLKAGKCDRFRVNQTYIHAAAGHGNSSNQYGNRDKKGLNSQIWRYYRVNLNIVF